MRECRRAEIVLTLYQDGGYTILKGIELCGTDGSARALVLKVTFAQAHMLAAILRLADAGKATPSVMTNFALDFIHASQPIH